ncbi:MAG: hypothetical protein EU541_07710 [Promethearchaeota archaeon]|nr:MAG: hypothetical protein EU541_07710 [Candidatus Lokiarchaeota archaeon]
MKNQKLIVEPIERKGKQYYFSKISLILFPLGSILLAILLIEFFELRVNTWWQEITAKQACYLLNNYFNTYAYIEYIAGNTYPWIIKTIHSSNILVLPDCTGSIAISIACSIIIFTPHSKDPKIKYNIIWRKVLDIILTVSLIHLFNVVRIAFLVYFLEYGVPYHFLHESAMMILSIIIHLNIFLFCNKLIREWYMSILYSGKILYNYIFLKKNIVKTV